MSYIKYVKLNLFMAKINNMGAGSFLLPPRSEYSSRKDWEKACEKLGLYVVPSFGKGSHCAVYKDSVCPPEDNSSCCVVTIPRNIYPEFQRDLVKKVLFYGLVSGKYVEKDVWEALEV